MVSRQWKCELSCPFNVKVFFFFCKSVNEILSFRSVTVLTTNCVKVRESRNDSSQKEERQKRVPFHLLISTVGVVSVH